MNVKTETEGKKFLLSEQNLLFSFRPNWISKWLNNSTSKFYRRNDKIMKAPCVFYLGLPFINIIFSNLNSEHGFYFNLINFLIYHLLSRSPTLLIFLTFHFL